MSLSNDSMTLDAVVVLLLEGFRYMRYRRQHFTIEALEV
jgi:hypothetical protein